MATKKPQLQIVEVIWHDADNEIGWVAHDPEKDDTGIPMRSYGILVTKGKKFITLSYCFNREAGEWLGKHLIPKQWIEKITVLKVVDA